MIPDPTNLINIAGITHPLIGFYDAPDDEPFKPFARPARCIFAYFKSWQKGNSTRLTEGSCGCRGGSYWIGGEEFTTQEKFAKTLNEREGFKATDALMQQWVQNQKPYRFRNQFVIIGPLKDDQYEFLKTVTFFVNPDQLSLLVIGAEYSNASIDHLSISAPFGSGCGQLAAVFEGFDESLPRAVIGATDIAMRPHLPPNIMAFTVNKAMYQLLCELNEKSFLYKSFWKNLQEARKLTKSSRVINCCFNK